MYACICSAVTDAAVREVVCTGARTVDEVSAATGAGTACGSCHDHLSDLIEAHFESPATSVAAAS